MPANRMIPSRYQKSNSWLSLFCCHIGTCLRIPLLWILLTQDHSYLDLKQTLPPFEVWGVYLHQQNVQPVVEMTKHVTITGARCQCWAVIGASHSDRGPGFPFPEGRMPVICNTCFLFVLIYEVFIILFIHLTSLYQLPFSQYRLTQTLPINPLLLW